jgi:hypothetical protein
LRIYWSSKLLSFNSRHLSSFSLSLSRCYHRIIITKQNTLTMTVIYSGLDLKLQSSLAVLWDHWSGRVRVMVFNATFNNISAILWRSVLLVEETRVPVENHWPVTSHWQTMRPLKGRQLKWSFIKKSGIFFNHNIVTKWGFNCLQRCDNQTYYIINLILDI